MGMKSEITMQSAWCGGNETENVVISPIYSLITESLQAKSCYLLSSILIYFGQGNVVLSGLSNIKR